MIATSHVIIGGAVGTIVGQAFHDPVAGATAALSVGVVSHLICDRLPHLDLPPNAKFINNEIIWDKSLYIFAITDSVIALLLTLAIWIFKFNFDFSSAYAWGALGGYLPDLIDNFPLWNKHLHQALGFKQFHQFHHWIHDQWRHRYPMPKYWVLGTLTQIIVGLPCLYYLLR